MRRSPRARRNMRSAWTLARRIRQAELMRERNRLGITGNKARRRAAKRGEQLGQELATERTNKRQYIRRKPPTHISTDPTNAEKAITNPFARNHQEGLRPYTTDNTLNIPLADLKELIITAGRVIVRW